MIRKSLIFLPLVFQNLLFLNLAYPYSINDYFNEASSKDASLKAVAFDAKAAEYSLRLPESITAIRLLGDVNFIDDGRPTMAPSFQGYRTTLWKASVGLGQSNEWGFDWKVAANLSRTKLFGTNLAQADFYDAYPSLEATIPLWRGFLGGEVAAKKHSATAAAQLQAVQAKIARATKMIEIEKAFYQFGIEDNLKELSQTNLNRSQKLYSYIEGRQKRNLVDRSDALQARAALSLRKLDFDRVQRDFRSAKAEFNSHRNFPEEAPISDVKLELLNSGELKLLASQPKTSLNDQLRLASAQLGKSQAREKYEAARPNLDLKGAFILQGRDDTLSGSYHDISAERRNLWSVGLSFSAPLDFSLNRDLSRAASLSESAADERIGRNNIDERLTWIRTQEDLLRCAESIDLLRDLEDSQKRRLAAEEQKYKNGRSSLFLVLTAEQDFVSAQAQKWANELQCRVIRSQTRFFEETSDGKNG